MTAKESLRLLLDDLSEEDAAKLLCEAEKLAPLANGTSPTSLPDAPRRPLSAVFAEIMGDLTEEDLASIPPAADVDRVVYGTPDPRV